MVRDREGWTKWPCWVREELGTKGVEIVLVGGSNIAERGGAITVGRE